MNAREVIIGSKTMQRKKNALLLMTMVDGVVVVDVSFLLLLSWFLIFEFVLFVG
jgi:hypothetical protein